MILGVGVDLLGVARCERAAADLGADFARDFCTPAELAACAASREPPREQALRFAAKEALFKALALAERDGSTWREAEVESTVASPPRLRLHGRLAELARARGVCRIHLALTAAPGLAAAAVLLEGEPLEPNPEETSR
ncbi:MAG TPA: 4'-phosphopantetheinyl transferase superfamily protein [Thermoanaerobaculia bacterium]|nr:4'-phosphopantetheinyl transferase superfamily protein [Thermoanaerobaculia bacterium]